MLEFGNENYWLALLLEDAALQELYRHQTWSVIPGLSRNEFLADLLSAAGLYYNQIGLHYKQAGFRYDAYTNIETAIEIAEANNIDACTYYKNLVDLCVASYDFDKALLAGDKAYRLSESDNNKTTFGTTLCLCQFLAHKPISSEIIVESSKSLQSLINRIFSFTSMDERKNFWSNYELYFPMLNLFAYKSGNTKLYGQICNNILVEKGLLLRTANSLRNQILETGNTEDIQSYDHLLQLRKLLPTLSHNESQSVNSEIDRIDKHLTQKFASYANFTSSFNLTWNNIQEHLNDEDIAIEFYNIPETTWHKDCKDVDGKVRYCAITLRKGYTIPHIIPLFTEERLQSIEQEDLYETDSVYNLIWKPLEEELRGVRNIYFAADRELHKIGIEYAPMPNGSIIGDKYSMYRLSSTRVIVENRAEKRSENAVLYGGLRYDIGKNELVAESRSGNYHPTSALRAFTSESNRFGVKYLPGTLKEVEEISRSFNNKPRLITDINGTEESFKSLAGSPVDIIHLATHGFFWSEDDAKKRNYVSFLSNMQNLKSDEDKALTRSGLFFSGANLGLRGESLPDDVEDGVLTALELSNMNLGHVDMVVMSACESGLGETTGEGVFGLQRGFKLAGANTLLMSLWKVDDTATQLLMTNFYKNYLAGKSKQESLKLAQRTLRKNSEYSAPEYWAAFILLDGLN